MKLQKLRPGLLFISILLFGAICTMSYLAFENIRKASNATEKLINSQELLHNLEDAMEHITDMERSQKNYLITGDDLFLKEYDSIVALIRMDTVNMKKEWTEEHRSHKSELFRIIRLIKERLAQGDSAMAKTKLGDIEGAASIMHTLMGRRYIDSLMAVERKLEQNEDVALEDSQLKDKLAAGSTATWMLSVATLLLILLGFSISIMIRDLKKNEAFMSRFNEELNEQVKKAQKDLLSTNEELRKLNSHLQSVREEERTRIAREVHDELGQKLTFIKMGISRLHKRSEQNDPDIHETTSELLEVVKETKVAIRKISSELRPALLDEFGLKAAIDWLLHEFARSSGIALKTVIAADDRKLPEEIKITVFRILQESLTNVARHAQARELSVKYIIVNNNLELLVEDDGIGFVQKEEDNRETLGLIGMRERAASISGTLEIESQLNKGTSIRLHVKLPS